MVCPTWCVPALYRNDFRTNRVNKAINTSDDGLWQPLSNKRIHAVMRMASEGWWLFGERGLANADRPDLVIAATNDEIYKVNVLILNSWARQIRQ